MLSVFECFNRLCNALGEKPTVKVCRDYKYFYGFFVAPPDTNENETTFVNNFPYLVDKRSGRVYLDDEEAPILNRERFTFVDKTIINDYAKKN